MVVYSLFSYCQAADRVFMQESKDLQPLVETWLAQIPAARLAEVTDLQTAIVYMASDASSYMIGHNLVVDGGQSIW